MNILVICLGNICRSPLAAAILEAYISNSFPDIASKLTIKSAGTYSHTKGRPADSRSMAVAAKNETILPGLSKILASHRACPVTIDDIISSDFILVMDFNNLADIKALINAHRTKTNSIKAEENVLLFGNFSKPDPKLGHDIIIEDPWYGSPSDFEVVFKQCYASARGFITFLKSKGL